jgi:Ino eighty subunit 1
MDGSEDESRASSPARQKERKVPTAGKIRHLKKEDGVPLWRKDIQYDFLKAVFDNEEVEFTNSYEPHQVEKQTFADLYIDTMARSSKTSKVLRDKLLSDREAAKSMAMVCLLVNMGRMNTTLNFFPEMRAQLRTYHAIPSLQAYQDATAYKQLQDAPRLKSILKGAAEDRNEPRNLTEFKGKSIPRTNPVNLIFLLCQQAPQVAELHFPPNHEFHDLLMKTNYTSASRANAFLWLMWFYLESDFTEEGCEENPYGAGVDYGTEVANQGVPHMTEMTPQQESEENIDPQVEIDFGLEKQALRAKIIAADQAYVQDHQPSKRGSRIRMAEDSPSAAILPRIRPSKHDSDMDSVRSTPPPSRLSRMGASSTGRRGGGSLKYQIYDASSPAASGHGAIEGIVPRKPRPPTAHQLAVEYNRNMRVEYILDRGIRKERHRSRKLRRQEGTILRAKQRLDEMRDPFVDSEEEDYRAASMEGHYKPHRALGFGGLSQNPDEEDDFGEEFESYAAAIRRAARRLQRWDRHHGSDAHVVAPVRRKIHRSEMENSGSPHELEDDDHHNVKPKQHKTNGNAHESQDAQDNDDIDMEDMGEPDNDNLDWMEKALLGETDDDEELDDVERTLLGVGDDESDVSGD